jgi:hypothetical protein
MKSYPSPGFELESMGLAFRRPFTALPPFSIDHSLSQLCILGLQGKFEVSKINNSLYFLLAACYSYSFYIINFSLQSVISSQNMMNVCNERPPNALDHSNLRGVFWFRLSVKYQINCKLEVQLIVFIISFATNLVM